MNWIIIYTTAALIIIFAVFIVTYGVINMIGWRNKQRHMINNLTKPPTNIYSPIQKPTLNK